MALTVLDGRPVAVTSGDDQTVRVWDAATGREIGDPPTRHFPVRSLATATVDDHPLALLGGDARTARLVDLGTGQALGEPLRGHADTVNAVALGTVNGRAVAVTGSWDATVRAWDALTGDQLGAEMAFPAPVHAVALAPDGLVAVGFGSELGAFRL